MVIPHGWEFQSYLVREFCMSVWTRPNCFDLILAAVTKYRTGCEIHVMRHLGVIRDAEPDVSAIGLTDWPFCCVTLCYCIPVGLYDHPDPYRGEII